MAYKKKMTGKEKEIADEVADEILTVEEEDHRLKLLLILLFISALLFLVSSISFAIFDEFYRDDDSYIDIGTDIVVDDVDNKGNKGEEVTRYRTLQKSDSSIILFNFSEKSNYIHMENVLPTKDSVGKKLTGDGEYFDFNISATVKDPKKGKIVYEISFVPSADNTISPSDIRVHLLEDEKEVSITGNDVNTYSELPDSSYRKGAKVLYRNSVSDVYNGNYTFRMWYSIDAKVYNESKKFGGKIAVDAHYE